MQWFLAIYKQPLQMAVIPLLAMTTPWIKQCPTEKKQQEETRENYIFNGLFARKWLGKHFWKGKWDHFMCCFKLMVVCGGMSLEHAKTGNNSVRLQNPPVLNRYGTFNTTGYTEWEARFIHFSKEWADRDELNEAMPLHTAYVNCELCWENKHPSYPKFM